MQLCLLLRDSTGICLGNRIGHSRALARGVLRHMQHNAHRQARLDELLGIANHAFGCFTPGVAVGPREH